MKTSRTSILALSFVMALISIGYPSNSRSAVPSKSGIKNIIIMIPDGMGITHTTIARWYQGGKPLAIDKFASGLIRTYSANSLVTDSAAAATAMATGHKTDNGMISMVRARQDGKIKSQTVASVLENAKSKGYRIGIVATSQVQHATPASFSAHVESRKNMEEIARQQVLNLKPDVVLGGGANYLLSQKRSDGVDLVAEIKRQKYSFVTDREQMLAIKKGRLWGAFASEDLPYEIDREKTKIPSLAEMAAKALELFSSKRQQKRTKGRAPGFLLMVEGSKIDWAAHDHDPVGLVSEILSFNNAAAIVLEFAMKQKDTLVIIAPDHSTGGPYLVASGTELRTDKSIAPLSLSKRSAEFVGQMINKDRSNIEKIVRDNYYPDLNAQELKILKQAPDGEFTAALVSLWANRLPLNWSTEGHTGEEVCLYIYHPRGRNQGLAGVIENTDIAKYINSNL